MTRTNDWAAGLWVLLHSSHAQAKRAKAYTGQDWDDDGDAFTGGMCGWPAHCIVRNGPPGALEAAEAVVSEFRAAQGADDGGVRMQRLLRALKAVLQVDYADWLVKNAIEFVEFDVVFGKLWRQLQTSALGGTTWFMTVVLFLYRLNVACGAHNWNSGCCCAIEDMRAAFKFLAAPWDPAVQPKAQRWMRDDERYRKDWDLAHPWYGFEAPTRFTSCVRAHWIKTLSDGLLAFMLHPDGPWIKVLAKRFNKRQKLA
jgi:hypothetical protein